MTRRSALHRLTLALGSVATAPLTSALLSGCRTPAAGRLAAYDYQALTPGRQRLVAALVDQIIPATDTLGASGAGVPQFLDLMLTGWYPPDERARFLANLDAIEARAGGAFADLSADAQAALVATLDAGAYADVPAEEPGAERSGTGVRAETDSLGVAEPPAAPADEPPFFRQLKELTLAGYYTSEVGMTQELQWDPVQGHYDPDLPITGPAWAAPAW